MRKKYYNLKNLNCIELSDRVYYNYNLQGKLYIIYKLEKQYYSSCIQEKDGLKEKNKKHYYCQVIIDYKFKSDIHFNKILENTNKKINQKVYTNQIFNKT